MVAAATSTARSTLRSYLGQAGYTYAGRYQVQGSVRLDGSSQLPATDYWQPTYGAQVTWHAKEERFLQLLSWLNTLNLWLSAGRSSNAGNFYDRSQLNQRRLAPSGPLALERLGTQEAGLSIGFPQNITTHLAVYQRVTTPIFLLSGPTPTLPGVDYQVRGKGLELALSWTFMRDDFTSSTSMAAAWQQSRYEGQYNYLVNPFSQLATNGQPLSTFQGLRYLGVDAASGQPQYQHTNGSTTTPLNQPLGAGLPRVLLNWAQNFDYQRWHLHWQADALLGYQVFNTSLLRLDSPGGFYNSSTRVLDRWTPTHPTASVPEAGLGPNDIPSTYYLQSGNQVRLSSISLSYAVLERSPHNITVWMGGTNLLVLSAYRGFDPNVSSGGARAAQAGLDASAYPVARTWLLGVRAAL